MFEQKSVVESDLTADIIHQILQLKSLEWPERYNENNYDKHWNEFPSKRGFCSGRKFVLIYEGERLVATAEQFPRTIQSEETSIEILALAGVLSHPDYRGRGLGRLVVEPVFNQIDEGAFPFCLFQTPVPGFYAHMGAIHVEDRFYNGLVSSNREKSIWWEDHIMIYPGNRPWLKAPIDLNGPAY
jgi:GNAT superfamily N-acetyltransferase